jgi:hypothetical protein
VEKNGRMKRFGGEGERGGEQRMEMLEMMGRMRRRE